MDVQNIQSWLNGEILRSGWLRKQYRLIALIAGLIFVYILSGYISMQQMNRLSNLKKEVKDAKYEYLTISAKLMESTRQSQIASNLEEKESKLQEGKKPTIRIR